MLEWLFILILFIIGVIFLAFAIKAFRKDWKVPSTLLFLMAFLCLFSGYPGFRGFIKTVVVDLINTYGAKLEEFQKTIEVQTERISSQQSRLEKIHHDIQLAQEQLKKQQEELAKTDRLVKALFSSRTTEYFLPDKTPDRIVLLEHQPNKISVYLLLEKVPIPETLDLQWSVFLQPKGSYEIQDNLVVFRWGDSASKLREKPLTATFVPDPSSLQIHKQMLIKDGRLLVDGKPVRYAFQELEPDANKEK